MNKSGINSSSKTPVYYWEECDDGGPSAGFIILLTTYSSEFLLSFPSNLWLVHHILRQRSQPAGVPPSDFFPLNLAIAQLAFSLVPPLFFANHFLWQSARVLSLITILTSMILVVKPVVLCLVCVERYLAVVRPVDYLRFKAPRYKWGCFVALLPFFVVMAGAGVMLRSNVTVCALFLPALAIDSFCSLSILKALKRPPPGDRGKAGKAKEERDRREEGENMAGTEGRKGDRGGKMDVELQRRALENCSRGKKDKEEKTRNQNGSHLVSAEGGEQQRSSGREGKENKGRRRKIRGEREMNSTKRKAFIAVSIIQAVLTVNYVPFILTLPMNEQVPPQTMKCQYVAAALAAALSCGYLQPLLYLHRLGRLPCLAAHSR